MVEAICPHCGHAGNFMFCGDIYHGTFPASQIEDLELDMECTNCGGEVTFLFELADAKKCEENTGGT